MTYLLAGPAASLRHKMSEKTHKSFVWRSFSLQGVGGGQWQLFVEKYCSWLWGICKRLCVNDLGNSPPPDPDGLTLEIIRWKKWILRNLCWMTSKDSPKIRKVWIPTCMQHCKQSYQIKKSYVLKCLYNLYLVFKFSLSWDVQHVSLRKLFTEFC